MSIKHQHSAQKPVFMDFDEIEQALLDMECDDALDTKSRPAKGVLPADSMSFHEMHVLYLKEHPKVNPAHYLSNLRAMIKIRSSR